MSLSHNSHPIAGKMKKIEGYAYMVSRDGKLYNALGLELKGSKDKKGYVHVTLSKDGVKKTFLVHRLVAVAYVVNPAGYSQVNHIDGDKSNNNADNLEWVTASENIAHAHTTGLSDYSGERNGRAKLSDVVIKSIREDFANGITRKELADKYAVSYSHVVSILANKRR